MYLKTNIDGYVKDKKTGIVINRNQSDLSAYKKQRDAIKRTKKLEADLCSLKAKEEENTKLLQELLSLIKKEK
jgi:hypothetical protein